MYVKNIHGLTFHSIFIRIANMKLPTPREIISKLAKVIFYLSITIIPGIILLIPLFILKLIEILVATAKIPKEGKLYRDAFLNFLEKTKWRRTLERSEIEIIEKGYTLQWPLVWNVIIAIGEKRRDNPDSIMYLFLNDILVGILYRQPFIVSFSFVILLILFLLNLLACETIILIIAFLLLALISSELAYLFLRRAYLGFTDNFRADFELDISYSRLPGPKYTWSISEFVFKILRAISFYLASSILGFYAIFLGLQQFDKESFSFAICANEYWQLFYFTIVTFATVGYGDITPGTIWAQFFVVCEILVGFGTIVFLFFAISTTLNPEKRDES